MATNNNLKDYLIDLYQGIASRKANASKNPQDFRSEIENLVFTSDAKAAASDIRAGKTASVNDEYLQKAENYLFNELAVALDMSYDAGKEYFNSRVEQASR